MKPLPIDTLREEFVTSHHKGDVVLTAPTGSGKSTRIPTFCTPPVLIIQPRRVAATSLAQRVASEQGLHLGESVGYIVRDDRRTSPDCPMVFVTTGVAIRFIQSKEILRFNTVIIDEFHERTLDLDLLMALLHHMERRIVVMSATLQAQRLASHLDCPAITGTGRAFPVDICYTSCTPTPSEQRLEQRVLSAVRLAPTDGDILVFLPGRALVRSVAQALERNTELEVLELHGQLTLDQQRKTFSKGSKRRVICSTNVAETSVTLPNIRVVIDSGLVKRTRYHRGRSTLTLSAISTDSADQRAGRAGRVAAGVALRLWSPSAQLAPFTAPEIHRESLENLVLSAASCGYTINELPFLDAPKPYAIDSAKQTLTELGALKDDRITTAGERLFALPLDPALARLTVATKKLDAALRTAIIHLVAALSVQRPLFQSRGEVEENLKEAGCDATALIAAVHRGVPARHGLNSYALKSARALSAKLHKLLKEKAVTPTTNREKIAVTIIEIWPFSPHMARHRKRATTFSNGSTELSLSRFSAVDSSKQDAILVLSVVATARHRLEQQLYCPYAMPVKKSLLARLKLGHVVCKAPTVRRRVIYADLVRLYAGSELEVTEGVPTGEAAQQALKILFLRGTLFNVRLARARHADLDLFARLNQTTPPPPFEKWVDEAILQLGFEDGRDLQLIDASDLTPPALSQWDLDILRRKYPSTLTLPDATYSIEYDPQQKKMTLLQKKGTRKTTPPLRFVPTLPGWSVDVIMKGVRRTIRSR